MILRSAKLWSRVSEDYRALPEDKRGPGKALTPEEEKRLWNVANSNPDWLVAYCAALVAANTTARGCEIKSLRISDVNLTTRTMNIRRASTKTDAGCRVVPLNDTATWALTRLVQRAASLGATTSDCYLLPAFRFRRTKQPSSAGAGFDLTAPMRSWRSAWRQLTRAIECPKCRRFQAPADRCRNNECKAEISKMKSPIAGLRFHDLRHHCITKLAETGVAEQTLMAIAGHVSREMLEHYSHIRMQAKRDAVASLDCVIPKLDP